jgi:hypothetical protein
VSLALLLAVLALATFRLTRLVTRDDFPPVFWARTRIQRARPLVTVVPTVTDGTPQFRYWWLGELVSCHWCASAYVSAGLVGVTWLLHGLPLPVFSWLAVWGAGAFVANLADD